MIVLALDSSGPVASVALARREEESIRLIGGFRLQAGLTHSETLMPLLEQMTKLARFDIKDADYIAVTSGPGSFTGLRIGAASAKGLSFALNKPLVPVPTLDAIAYQMAGEDGIVCPMMDARRSQVYTAVYRMSGTDGTCSMETILSSRAVSVSEIAAELNRICKDASGEGEKHIPLILMGDGVSPYLGMLKEELAVPFLIPPFHRDLQSAEAVAALAFSYIDEGRFLDAEAFVPEYIRPSQAERTTGIAPE